MKKAFQYVVLPLLLFCSAALLRAQSDVPRVFLMDAKSLGTTKEKVAKHDANVEPAIRKIEADAKKVLEGGVYSVTTKGMVPPSGDKHDYMSQAPYFWPDPTKKDGMPYIRKDGERNPEINGITDHTTLDKMESGVETTALAYYLTGNDAYAKKSVELLRAWFLDPATRMNPNLEYGQYIPGVNTGRGIGLIETRGLTRVVDSIGLLENSKALTDKDRQGLKDWYAKFLTWMQESKNGREESASKNNHGTYYDLQITSYALFLGNTDLAKRTLETAKTKRIALQVESDGREPLELVRTKAWSYSIGNLEGLMELATLGESVGVDLWHFQTADGRSIRKALDYLYSFAVGEKWKYEQIGGFEPQALYPAMRRAAAHYNDAKFKEMMAKIPPADPSSKDSLVLARAF